MNRLDKYKAQQKKKALSMLEELQNRISRNELIVTDFGFWPSNLDNRVTFRIIVISRDDEKEIQSFEKI